MPKFLDDIKFIDSQGDEHNVSEYNNQIRKQGGYYTGDSHLERFDGKVPTMTIPQGEISKQGRYFTGLNANDDSVITKKNKEITEFDSSLKYRYGYVVSVTSNGTTNYYKCIKNIPEDESIEISNTEYWKKIDRDDAFYYEWNYNIEEAKEGEIYKQGRYWVDRVEEVAQTDSIWGAIEELQQKGTEHDSEISELQQKDTEHDSEIEALQQKDTEHDSEIDALQEFDNSHNNIENGEGEGSIEQKDFTYTGDSIVFSDGTKGTQLGDVVPGAIASGYQSVALGGLRYDYYTSPETHAANLVIDPESTENWGRTPTSAEGNQSFAFGASCHAIGTFSVSGVKDSISYQRGSVSIGGTCIAGKTEEEFNEFWYDANQDKAINGGKGKKDGFITDSQGYNYKESYAFSIAMGDTCTSIGRGSISIGGGNIASGTYALAAGRSSKATSQVSIALGHQTISSGAASIAAGYNVKALSSGSISLGYSSDSSVGISRGVGTIALGVNCTAGDDSGNDYGATAIGFGALSVRRGAVALGKYNKLTEGALLMVGNGLGDSNRSNAFEVLEDGRAKVYGEPTESNDVLRLNDFSVLTQEQVGLLF